MGRAPLDIAVSLPRRGALSPVDEPFQRLGQAAALKVPNLDLGHIQPITMHWGAMELEVLDNGVRAGYHEKYRACGDSRKAL